MQSREQEVSMVINTQIPLSMMDFLQQDSTSYRFHNISQHFHLLERSIQICESNEAHIIPTTAGISIRFVYASVIFSLFSISLFHFHLHIFKCGVQNSAVNKIADVKAK